MKEGMSIQNDEHSCIDKEANPFLHLGLSSVEQNQGDTNGILQWV